MLYSWRLHTALQLLLTAQRHAQGCDAVHQLAACNAWVPSPFKVYSGASVDISVAKGLASVWAPLPLQADFVCSVSLSACSHTFVADARLLLGMR
jgi:hypothetical protein